MEEGIKRILYGNVFLSMPDVTIMPAKAGAKFEPPSWWHEIPEDPHEAITFMRVKLEKARPT